MFWLLTCLGRFLLAVLHMDSLTGKKTVRAVRNALQRLEDRSDDPKDMVYDQAYDEAMARIRGQNPDVTEIAMSVLTWITHARRPLEVEELQYALAIEEGDSEVDGDNTLEVDDLINPCVGLVTIDQTDQTVRLVHYTTQEYLERRDAAYFPEAELRLANTCLRCLLFHKLYRPEPMDSNGDMDNVIVLRHDFYDYVMKNWHLHVRCNQLVMATSVVRFLECPSKREKLTTSGWLKHSPRNRVGDSSWTAIHYCAYFDFPEICAQLLGRGYNADSRDEKGMTPLAIAARFDSTEVTKLLIARSDVDVNAKDEEGETPLVIAADWSSTDAVKLLTAHNNVDVNSKNKEGKTPLALAAMYGDIDMVKFLIAHSDVDVEAKDEEGMTPLAVAAYYGETDTVKLLIARSDVDVEARNEEGNTPLAAAAFFGETDIIKLLIMRSDVDVNAKNKEGRTPMAIAARYGNWDTVKLLIARSKGRGRVDAIHGSSKKRFG